MARFDVYRMKDGEVVVDCQAEIHRNFETRLIVPLVVYSGDYPLKRGLNPVFELDGERYVLVAEFASTVLLRDIRKRIGSLDTNYDEIVRALDFLISGF